MNEVNYTQCCSTERLNNGIKDFLDYLMNKRLKIENIQQKSYRRENRASISQYTFIEDYLHEL